MVRSQGCGLILLGLTVVFIIALTVSVKNWTRPLKHKIHKIQLLPQERSSYLGYFDLPLFFKSRKFWLEGYLSCACVKMQSVSFKAAIAFTIKPCLFSDPLPTVHSYISWIRSGMAPKMGGEILILYYKSLKCNSSFSSLCKIVSVWLHLNGCIKLSAWNPLGFLRFTGLIRNKQLSIWYLNYLIEIIPGRAVVCS